jgi:hypothetical protein
LACEGLDKHGQWYYEIHMHVSDAVIVSVWPNLSRSCTHTLTTIAL